MTNEEIATLVNHARSYDKLVEDGWKALQPFEDIPADDPRIAPAVEKVLAAQEFVDDLKWRVLAYIERNP